MTRSKRSRILFLWAFVHSSNENIYCYTGRIAERQAWMIGILYFKTLDCYKAQQPKLRVYQILIFQDWQLVALYHHLKQGFRDFHATWSAFLIMWSYCYIRALVYIVSMPIVPGLHAKTGLNLTLPIFHRTTIESSGRYLSSFSTKTHSYRDHR